MLANPDAFVFLVPTPWEPTLEGVAQGQSLFKETFASTWSTSLECAPGDNPTIFSWQHESCDNPFVTVVEPPIPELVEAEQCSLEPLAATEKIRIEQHASIWRFVFSDNQSHGLKQAKLGAQVMEAMCRSYAPCVFIPATMRLHPVGVIRTFTANLDAPDAITKLYISAWHRGREMFTRGLTAFGLPELSTLIDSGHNAAFFRLMDLATDMIQSGRAIDPGTKVDLGRDRFKIALAEEPLEDPSVPHSGKYGLLRLIPTATMGNNLNR